MISGHLRAANELSHRCMELAQSSEDSGILLEAHHLFWSNEFYMGDYVAAESHAEQGIATYDPVRHHPLKYAYSGHDPGVCCRAFSAMMLLLRGFPLRAFSYVHLMRHKPDAGQRWAEMQVGMSEKYVLPLLLSQGKFQLGWALADPGKSNGGNRCDAGVPDRHRPFAVTGEDT